MSWAVIFFKNHCFYSEYRKWGHFYDDQQLQIAKCATNALMTQILKHTNRKNQNKNQCKNQQNKSKLNPLLSVKIETKGKTQQNSKNKYEIL